MPLPPNPTLYEINTWVWLNDLGRTYGRAIDLGSVPDAEWDALAALHIDAVWLMGVWQRSPAGRAIALHNVALVQEFQRTLPDYTPADVVGSPYCIRAYVVEEALGGRAGLAIARQALAARGIALLLDFVPNHVAPDHPWTLSHPEYFIQGSPQELASSPADFLAVGEHVLARGRDPFYPPWADVVQLNAFAPGLREIMQGTLLDIAAQCDGVRCDMAMLVINEIFASTWGARAGTPPAHEFWTDIIGVVKNMHPHFLWMAEAYWDTEPALQQLGFDYCYDKRLYDHLVAEDVAAMQALLRADPAWQRRLVRFIENHDEPRAATLFAHAQGLMAAVATATQAGMRFFHEGQFEGRKIKVSVFLGRRPGEEVDADVRAFYTRLLALLHTEPLRSGTWRLCAVEPVPGDQDAQKLLAWCWQSIEEPQRVALIVVNPTRKQARGQVRAPIAVSAEPVLRLRDAFADTFSQANASRVEIDEYLLSATGIACELAAYGYRLLVPASIATAPDQHP